MSLMRASGRIVAILMATASALGSLLSPRPGALRRVGAVHDGVGMRWARRVRRAVGMEVVVQGELPAGPAMIVANHPGYMDIVALWCVVPGAFVARADVAHWPLVGIVSRRIGTVFIDRSRKRDLLRVIPELSGILAQGRSVILFPEATSSPGIDVLPFRSGLFEAASRQTVPVVAVSVRYETEDPAPIAAHSVCWWGGMTFVPHLFALLRIPRFVARLHFSPPISPSKDRKELCRSARDRVIKSFEPTAPPGFDRTCENPTRVAIRW